MTSSRGWILVATVLGALLLGDAGAAARRASAAPPDAVPAPAVGREVRDRVQRDGAARVLVELRLPAGRHTPEGELPSAASAAQRQAIAAARAQVISALGGASHRVLHRYESVPFVALEVGPAALRALETSGASVARVFEDRLNRPVLAESAPLIQADQVWAQGDDGAGTVIAIVDSGVDAAHPFLAGRVVEEACYSTTSGTQSRTLCPNGQDEQTGPGAAAPCALAGCEHGTHVAGIAAGNGAAAGQPFSGIARGAGLMAVQVFSRFNRFVDCGGLPPCLGAWDSDVLAALERVYALRAQHRFAAINMSLGGGSFAAPCDGEPYKPIIDNLRAAGIATVVAAGNSGETAALTSPACISSAISVGATTDADQVAAFSNASSFLALFAPGDAITSSVPGGGYATFSGTSMAAPHAAGGWALLRQARPEATVDEVLDALVATGVPVTDGRPGGTVTRPRIRLFDALVALSPDVLRIVSVSPAVGATGATLDVVIGGSGFQPGAGASFGPGVTVTQVSVTSPTRLTARVSIAPAAALGPRDVQVSNPDGQSAVKASAFRVMPPPPSLAVAYVGKLRDRVGPSGSAFSADGALDGTFRVTVVATQGYPRTITSLELRRSDGYGIYDTVAATSFWALGAANGLDGPLVNGPGGEVSLAVTDGQVVHLFASDATPTPLSPGASFTLTARFADATSATAVAVVPAAPAVTLAFLGRPRDRVGQGTSAFAGDGLADGAFRATVQSTQGLPRTVVSLELRRADGYGVYDTVASTSFWALGAASDLDGALLNGSGGAVSFPVADGQGFHLFAADASPSPFAAGQTFTLTVRFADGAVSTASTAIVLPPAPAVTLAYLGRARDRVGASSAAFAADGSPDGTFAVTIQANGLPRAVVELELRRSDGYGIYDTLATTSYWALGAARGLDAALLNGPGGAVSFAVSDGETFHVFAADGSPPAFGGGKTFALTARFADGTMATASAVIPAPLSLAYAGRLRDRVGQGNTAYAADGLLDGVFVVNVAASGAGRITQLELRRSDGYGIYDTVASTGFWALGVAGSVDGALLNAPATGAVDLTVSAGQTVHLFAGDVPASPFAPGAVFALTARYADGTTAVATATVGP